MTKKAGIMKIHNYSSQPPHEKVRTRSVVSREAQETNGTVRTVVGGASNKTPQKPAQKVASAPATHLSPELENTANRLTVEAGNQVENTPESCHDQVVEEEEQQQHLVATKEDVQVEEQQQAAKRRRVEISITSSVSEEVTLETNAVEEANNNHHSSQESELEQTIFPNEVCEELVETEQEADQQEQQEQQQQEAETDNLVEDLNEDDRTSSSTVSAEETLDQVMESFNKGRPKTINSLKQQRVEINASDTSNIDPLMMTMDGYQQQHQQQQDDAPMEEYETAVTVVGGGSVSASDDIEDTDGALAGNRLFRKKVKRKLPTRPSVSSGGGTSAGGSLTTTTDSGTICSAKAKLQMVHEFPMLFLGLRRNRMFLVNSLAQWFDLEQRDIILTLRKIKQNESSVRLGSVFGLGSTEVELLFHTNVPKIADCLRNFIVWPDDITMKLNVPISLRQHFQRIHLILNYLVVRVKQNAVHELPAEEVATSFCPNEQCHKLKYLVASTLDGCVCFVSRAFGIQTDDELVLSQSGFLTKFKTNTNLIAGKNFHNFEDQLANGHDHTNNNGRRNRTTSGSRSADGDDDLERVLAGASSSNSNSVDNFEDIVSEKISKSKTFKLKNYIENILENFQSHQLLSPQTCIDGRTLKLLDDIVVIVGALINLQKQEIE
uniref:DDE Tnp4 domain-containing protein n=1 Tax=Anopheles epiroticus TaxID=199890 RepID=A0A182P2J5_9DIPT